MKKIILTLIFCLVYGLLYAELRLNTRSWLTTSYVETTENELPEEYANVEVGLQLNVGITKNLKWNSLFVYESAYEDDRQLDFNYSFVQADYKQTDLGIGYRVGRLSVPFGFWSDTKFAPERPFVLQYYPTNMVWQNTRKLLTSIDGHSVFGRLHVGPACLEVEYLVGSNTDLRPREDYVQDFVGMEPFAQNVNYGLQAELYYNNFRIRAIESSITSDFETTKEFYSLNPLIPEADKVYDVVDLNYIYRYNAGEYYLGNYIFTLEKIDRLREANGTANDLMDKYYGFKLGPSKQQFWNAMVQYRTHKYKLWTNYGHDFIEDIDEETHRGFGISYDYFDKLILKGQYSNSHGTHQLTWKENNRNTSNNLKENWDTYAASITYVF